jgi:reactive intermediate/imine deaminase
MEKKHGPNKTHPDRIHISSAARWEEIVGYSRAVRDGNLVFVTGTTAFDEQGNLIGEGDVFEQAMQCIRNIEKALHQAGASLKDVVRTRIYVTDINQWEEVGRAHAHFFAQIRPATTMVEVSRLIQPEMLIEIEADAVIGNPNPGQK